MKKFFLSKILFLVFSFQLFSQNTTTPVLTVEYQALVDFYNATNGASWASKWDISSNNLHTTTWFGVTIDNGHVVGINLGGNNIKGAIPASFSNLKYLKNLNLSYGWPNYRLNDLSTTDLSNLSGLEALESLGLYYCTIKGVIPTSWSLLTKLKTINLNNNSFEGAIPAEIGDLKDLETIDFANNKLTSIPSTIGSLTKLKTIDFSANKFTGLPKELENLTALTSLNLNYNQVADTQAFLRSSVALYLNYQTLAMEEFIYNGNDVVINNLPNIVKYDRTKNDFSALNNFNFYLRGTSMGQVMVNANGSLTIPKSYISSIKKGDEIYLYQTNGTSSATRINFNKVTISLPAIPDVEYQALVDFYNATNGANWSNKWDVSVNNLNEGAWHGLSLEDGHISGVNLGGNNIRGAIPASFSNLKYLKSLNLSYGWPYYSPNDLSTTDFNNISGLESLESLGLYYCNAKGTLPISWAQLTKLKTINLNTNAFEGAIPDGFGLGNFKDLESIDFANNKFTSIPTSIGGLTKLKTIGLSTNKLTVLPKELESLTSLTSLDVNYNQIADTKALLRTSISLSLYYQTLSIDELVYKGEDVVLATLPNITKYDRNKNDFSARNTFNFYLRGSYLGQMTMAADGSITIPKGYLSSMKQGDDVYLYQNSGAAYTSTIRFKEITIDLPVIPDEEYQALVDFYNATNGTSWINKWDVSVNNLNQGVWYGISIEGGHITAINLGGNNIKGAIPSSFGNLKYLKILNLSYGNPNYYPNDLSSTDLNNLSGLESLETLNLYYCRLIGTIPTSWKNLTKLKTLNLNTNNLEGSIFNEIGDLKDLESIDFNANKFTAIPASIGGLSKLKTIQLSNNKLTNLPKELENLTSLTSLNVNYNEIVDTQALLRTNISLSLYYQSLSMDELIYTGEDVVLTNLPRITRYDRTKNDFSALNTFNFYLRGSYLGQMTMAADGSVTIPKEYLSSMRKGDDVYLYQNSGAAYTSTIRFKEITIDLPVIPDEEYQALVDFYNATNGTSWINKWDVSVNNLNEGSWYGIAIEGGHITGINLGGNNIKGAIPSSFGNLKYLKILNLSYGNPNYYPNDLSSTDLNNLSGLESLETLNLYYCNIKGAIPSTWSRLTKLKTLDLNNNGVTNLDSSFSTLKLTSLNFNSQTNNYDSIEIGANEISIDMPLYTVVAVKDQVVTFDARNEFQLYVNGSFKKTAFSNNGKVVFSEISQLNLKETDQIQIYQVNGIGYNSRINYAKVSFGIPLVDEEFEILKKIYTATDGANWTNKWDVSENNLNRVSWYGVTIKDGHVIYINLFNNNLGGTIPADITGLKYLKTLNLNNNKIQGSIPSDLHLMTDLEVFDVNSNSLLGAISTRIAELTKLKKFSIGNNKFSGNIPAALSDFVALEYLDLSSNGFDKIEKKIYYDYSKTYIDLRNQKINYNTILSVSGSKLQVDLSDIVKYDLENNNFEAKNSFALLVDNLTHTTTTTNEAGEVIFDNVRIAEIPQGAKIAIRQTTGSFINTEFNFAGIEDKSTVPVVESEYLALVDLFTKLNGSSWTNSWNTLTNNLHTNKWFGVTTYDGHIVGINLSGNNVTGVVPAIFGQFPNLTKLNLTSNMLTGVEAVLPSTVDFTYDRQVMNRGSVDLTTATVVNDLNINKYEHKKSGFFNQTYDVRIGSFSRTVNIPETGIKLMDLMTVWNVPNNQKVELRQISGEAKNTLLTYDLKYKMGDGNLDNKLNVLDIQTSINHILSNYIPYFNFAAADVNTDTKISILDVIGQVKIVQDQPVNRLANRKAPMARIDGTKSTLSIENGQLLLDTNGYEVASLEIRMSNVSKEAINELLTNQGFAVNIASANNQTSMIAYSFDKILSGKIVLAQVNESSARLLSALLSSVNATEIPSEIIETTLGINDFGSLNITKIGNYPNPFSTDTTIEFYSENSASKATVTIYDLNGKVIQIKELENVIKGQNEYKFNRNGLQPGVYIYVITTQNNTTTFRGKMTVN
jgi:Leucine-rich repeat (LRR) protein